MQHFDSNGKNILDFLSELNLNNSKEWFDKNREIFNSIMKDYKKVINELSIEISKFDPDFKPTKAEDYIFRIYKDLRFSKEKIPYKTHIGAYICNGGKKSPKAGYYLHLEPDNCFLGGGLYKPSTAHLHALRQEIYFSTNQFLEIINNPDFVQNVDGLMDDKAKKMPKDYSETHIAAEYLKYKSMISIKNIPTKNVFKNDFMDVVLKTFKSMQPLNAFINNALELSEHKESDL